MASRESFDVLSSISPSRHEYPFPRPGSSAGRFTSSRRGSTASSIHSVGGSLDTASHWHRLTESSQNAISTLLQPPIVRTGLIPHTSAPASSAHKPPTSRDIPPVTLTNIPNVDPAEFRPYLTQVGALYDALQRAKENEEEGGTQLLRKSSKVDDFSDLIAPERRSSKPNLSRQASLASLASSIETPLPRRRSSSGALKRAVHAPTPLSTIPNVYFEEDFHLENPRTFDVVSEKSEVVRPAPGTPDERRGSNGNAAAPRRALATNAILQEKLSWYMDTIEVHLISSISTASTSFFAALGSLKDLHSEAADSVTRIKELRKDLEALDQEMAIGGLTIVNKRRRRENLKQLGDAIQQLKQIVEAVASCDALVNKGNVENALDAIDGLEKLIASEGQEDDPSVSITLRDLRGIKALEGVAADLDTLRLRIGKTYEFRFLSTLIGDLRRHVETVSAPETLQRWSIASQRSRGGHSREPSAFPTYLSLADELRSQVLDIVGGLHRAKHTFAATTAYREAVKSELRNIIRKQMPASNDDDADSMMSTSTVGGSRQKSTNEKSSILARNLRALDPEDAEELLKQIYIGICETLRRVGTQVKVLLDVTSTLGDPSAGIKSPMSPNVAALEARQSGGSARGPSGREIQEEMHQTLDMSNLLGQAVDMAQDRIVKVLKVRSEQSTHLSVERFLRYFNLNLLFANECEQVSGRGGTSLKTVVNGHIKEFVQRMGESERQSLATGMEADIWAAKDFTEEDAAQLSRILSASTKDAEAWTVGSKVWLSASTEPSTLPPSKPMNGSLPVPGIQANGVLESGRSTPTPSNKTSTRSATIESESFILPASAVLCLHGLAAFLHLITGIPSMTNDIGSSIISYLSLFDSRCRQLILGAGATKSAGLKNITTKHLALASRSLSFIASLITHIREFVRRHASTNSSISILMGEFGKVRQSFLEHQQSIHDKLLDIMSSRSNTHVRVMKAVNWTRDPKSGVNTYMEDLAKETNTLHKVMTKHLPEETVGMIMQPIFKAYRDHWCKAYGEVILDSEDAQKRMIRDAEYFKTRIGGLEGAKDTSDHILKIVKEKPVPKAKVPSPAPTPPPALVEATPTNGTTSVEAEKEAKTEPIKEADVIVEEKSA